MKKLLCTLAFMVLSSSNLFAQYDIPGAAKFEYGEEIPDDSGKLVKIIGEANNKIYTLVTKENAITGSITYYIRVFGAEKMDLISTNKIVLPEFKDKDLDFEEIILLKDQLYVLGSTYHRKDKKHSLVATNVNEDGTLSNNVVTLFETSVQNKTNKGAFYLKVDDNNENVLISHISFFPKEDKLGYEMKLFDYALQQKFETTEHFGYDDDKKQYGLNIADFELNKNNDLFLLIAEGYRDKNIKDRITNLELHAYKASNNYKKEVITINTKGNNILNGSIIAVNNSEVKLAGLYSTIDKNGKIQRNIKGVFAANVSLKDNATSKVVFNDIDYETKVKILGKRKADKEKELNSSYYVNGISYKENGEITISYEFRQLHASASGVGPLSFKVITIVNNEIILSTINPDNTLKWMNVIPKIQMASYKSIGLAMGSAGGSANVTVSIAASINLASFGKGPEYLGAINFFDSKGDLNFIFNDNIKNKGITDIEKIKDVGNLNKSVPTIFTFDSNGNMTRKDPEEAIKNELILRPRVFKRNGDHILIYSSRKSQDKLGRLNIK